MARSYDKHFKEEALKLSDEIGAKKAADQLGIPYNTVTTWRGKRKKCRTDSTQENVESGELCTKKV